MNHNEVVSSQQRIAGITQRTVLLLLAAHHFPGTLCLRALV
ncbi:hypothetical protein OH491_08660 [Termitidicoccus mucosus]